MNTVTIAEYFSRENITLLIAIVSLVLSLINAIRDWKSNRKSISISVPFAFCNEHNAGYSFILTEFVNRSKLPVTVTRIQAMIDGERFELGRESVRMFEYTHPERKGRVADDSVLLPIVIDSLGYSKALFSISNWPQITKKEIKLEIFTNRGKIRKQTVEIAEIIQDTKVMHKRLG